jgi:group I intron endonuclease
MRLDEFGKLLIYLVRLEGKPVYVGQIHGSNQSVNRRWKQHCSGPFHGRKLWHAIQAHGLEKFTLEVIDEANDRDELNDKEQKWIRDYGTFVAGLNGNAGGISIIRLGQKHSEETKQIMREKKLGVPRSEETKQKIGLGAIGNKGPSGMKFGPRPEEVKERIRSSMTGVTHTEERKANQAKAAAARFADPAKKAAWYEKRWGKKKEAQVA